MPHVVADQAVEQPHEQPRKSVQERLAELKRGFQRQLNRKGTAIELAALDRAALMTLRAEIAAFDGKATSNDIVRLDNAARRARRVFETIARIEPPKRQQSRDMRSVVREVAHVR
jgi:hypothetical protein